MWPRATNWRACKDARPFDKDWNDMKPTFPGIALTLVLAILTAPTQAAPDAAGSVSAEAPSTHHAQDLRELFIGLRIFKSLQREPRNWATLSAPDREFDLAFRRQMSEEEVYRRLTPGYAALINPKQAAELARLTRAPAWRKREQRLHELNGASVYLSTFMTPGEIAETRRIDAAPAMLALRANEKKLHQTVQDAMDRWSRQFDQELNVRMVDVQRKVKSDMAANRESGSGGTITIGRVGVPYADKYAYITGSGIIKIDNAYNRFENRLKNLGFSDILKSEYLASKVSLAHSRTVVEQADAALTTLLNDVDLAIKEREEALSKLELPRQGESQRKIDSATGGAYGYMVDFGEGYRRLLDDHRRLLAFIAERSAKVFYEDGKLMFSTDQDLALARELFDKLDSSRADLVALVDRQIKKEEDAERRQRGERVEPAPKEQS
jgi:hypothetical protein